MELLFWVTTFESNANGTKAHHVEAALGDLGSVELGVRKVSMIPRDVARHSKIPIMN